MADELQVLSSQLPDNLEDLSKYVMVGREKLVAMQAAIRAINRVGLAEEIRKQKLEEAQDVADALLAAEVRLGELISELPESPGKRTDLEPEDSGVQRSKKEVLEDMGLSVKTAQRYEKLALHPEIVASISAESRDKGQIVSRTSVLRAIKQAEKVDEDKVKKKSVVATDDGNKEDERCIPQKYIRAAKKVLGDWIDDPAASDYKQIMKRIGTYHYTKKANGLNKTWGTTIWLFPPYYSTDRFVKKLLSSEKVREAIVLVNNDTDSKWFKQLWGRASAVLFHTGKIAFEIPEEKSYTGPDCGQVFFYLGDEPKKFLEEFLQFGVGTELVKDTES